MSVITPKDLAGRNFSLSFRGYNKEEVDTYITKVINNYSMLYRRCAELEEQVAVANVRLENIDKEEKRARNSLNSASETSDRIIAEAYEKADNILVSIKRNCDAILRDFRDKVDAKKDALAEMNARAELFKNSHRTDRKAVSRFRIRRRFKLQRARGARNNGIETRNRSGIRYIGRI